MANKKHDEKRNVVDKCLKLIKIYGGKAFKTDGNYKPDIIGCVLGKMVVIECKDKGLLCDLTEGQQVELRAWQKAGAVAMAIDDPNDLAKILEDASKWK